MGVSKTSYEKLKLVQLIGTSVKTPAVAFPGKYPVEIPIQVHSKIYLRMITASSHKNPELETIQISINNRIKKKSKLMYTQQ